ncbi:MAG TPA: hypothetical protein VF826_11790 [Chloroflexia bacterium]|jgi:hypothetical protein
MTATAPLTRHHVQYLSSPVRITTSVIELRDRLLPLEDVESAEVVKVVSGKESWDRWLGWIIWLGLFGSVSRLVRPEIWQLGLPQQVLVELGIVTLVLLVVAPIVRWFYSRASEGWRTYYVPRLSVPKGVVTLAAFEDEQRAVEVVKAIEEAQARSAASPGLEPETLYHLDNVVEISDQGVAINGGPPIPAWRLRVAYKNKMEVKQVTDMKSSLLWALGLGCTLVLIGAVGKPVIDIIGPYVAALVWGIIILGLLYAFIEWLRDEKRLQPLDEIYICRLRTDYDEFDALLTPDKWYVDAVMSAINSLVPKPTNRI